MRVLVRRDIPFIKRSIPTADAREIFREDKLYDKERLFRFRLASRTNMYELDGFRDYNYGFMAYSTGCLDRFKLIPYKNGILMQMPRRRDTDHIPPFEPMEKLFKAQTMAEEWAAKIHIEDIGELMVLINGDTDDEGDDIISETALYDVFCEAVRELDERSLNMQEIEHCIDELVLHEDRNAKERLSMALKVMVYAYLCGKCLKQIQLNLSRLRGEQNEYEKQQ